MNNARVSALEDPSADDEVRILRWPAQEELRRRLADAGVPRLLVLNGGRRAPMTVDPLEDWLREPVDPGELALRSATLHHRAQRSQGERSQGGGRDEDESS